MPKLEFAVWKRAVDALVQAMVHMSADDLPDIAYHDMWSRGATPLAAARKAIKEANG